MIKNFGIRAGIEAWGWYDVEVEVSEDMTAEEIREAIKEAVSDKTGDHGMNTLKGEVINIDCIEESQEVPKGFTGCLPQKYRMDITSRRQIVEDSDMIYPSYEEIEKFTIEDAEGKVVLETEEKEYAYTVWKALMKI